MEPPQVRVQMVHRELRGHRGKVVRRAPREHRELVPPREVEALREQMVRRVLRVLRERLVRRAQTEFRALVELVEAQVEPQAQAVLPQPRGQVVLRVLAV